MSEAESPDDAETTGALLFGEWSVDDIEYNDPSTERYVTVTPIAHTMGRHAAKQFQKSEISIVERLINRLMQTDENTGDKQKTMRITREAFEVVHERTGENPVQVLVRAVENSAPREETVRLKYGGISVPKAVDIAPQRRVDLALMFIAQGVYNGTYAVNQKEEKERVAAAAR
ncbi:30S ribosomal protein S7 [Halobacteriales archaeon QH_1_68_42]|nr:MAG: 30S ribosomal protein S7 [Halobacteriales archaeon QH_1_68_42]